MIRDDTFEPYDLTVVVEAIEGHCTCAMAVGDRFFVHRIDHPRAIICLVSQS